VKQNAKRLFFFIFFIPLNIQLERKSRKFVKCTKLFCHIRVLISFLLLFVDLVCTRRTFSLDLSFRRISAAIARIFLSYPRNIAAKHSACCSTFRTARFVIGAASFAKARTSERNDRRDKRRPQIYMSLES